MGETDVYRRSSADCSTKPVPSVSQCHDRNTELSIHSGQQSGSVLLAAMCQELMNLAECLHGRNNAAFAGQHNNVEVPIVHSFLDLYFLSWKQVEQPHLMNNP